MIFYGTKMNVAKFATALQLRFGKDEELYRITRVGKSEIYSVLILDEQSPTTVEIMASTYSLQSTNTSPEIVRIVSRGK